MTNEVGLIKFKHLKLSNPHIKGETIYFKSYVYQLITKAHVHDVCHRRPIIQTNTSSDARVAYYE